MKLARLGRGPEIFFSLQGEGRHLGRPSVFVRTSRCNLYCHFCDTPHTWNWSATPFAHQTAEKFDRESETVELSTAEVVDCIGRWPCRQLVLTGGEPLLQDESCADVAERARRRDPRYHVEVETNGTLVPSEPLDRAIDLFTVSPKLAHSGVPDHLRLRGDAIEHFARSGKSVFKFVVRDDRDLHEVRTLTDRHRIEADRVFLMPEGTDADTLARRRPGLAELCLSEGYRYSDRLQILLHGNQRGT